MEQTEITAEESINKEPSRKFSSTKMTAKFFVECIHYFFKLKKCGSFHATKSILALSQLTKSHETYIQALVLLIQGATLGLVMR